MDMHNKGDKHTCSNCGARFFDLLKLTAQCPKCGTIDQTKTGREAAVQASGEASGEAAGQTSLEDNAPTTATAQPDASPETQPDTQDPQLDDDLGLSLDGVESVEDDNEHDEDGLMEDTSDLSRLEDDVSEVLEHVETPERIDV